MRKASEVQHTFNLEFERVMCMADCNKLGHNLSPFYKRAAYAGTSQEVGEIHAKSTKTGHRH